MKDKRLGSQCFSEKASMHALVKSTGNKNILIVGEGENSDFFSHELISYRLAFTSGLSKICEDVFYKKIMNI